jgi:hypothetical protein
VASDAIGLGCRRDALYFVRATRNDIGHVVADVLAFLGEIVNRPVNRGARPLIPIGHPVTEFSRRIGHARAKFRRYPRGEPYRETHAYTRSRQQPGDKPTTAAIRYICVHVLELLSLTLLGA